MITSINRHHFFPAVDDYTRFQQESIGDEEFSYENTDEFSPPNWHLLNETCAGQRQSPININLFEVQPGNVNTPLEIEGAKQIPVSITASNNGHSMVLNFNYENNFKVKFTRGPLERATYHVGSVHWHWGDYGFGGSEHTINGLKYSAEAHFVSYNSKYGNS